MNAPRHKRRRATGSFRIIGGRWRGRRLRFPEIDQLRPTPDRVRETLFNWLTPIIDGAVCLDLYSGSGALGIEALSRGAAECTFVDHSAVALDAIRQHADMLQVERVSFVNAEALAYLKRCQSSFDIIFIDPPFDADAWPRLLHRIVENELLRPGGRIYLEAPATAGPPPLPATLALVRSKRAGRVGYHLASAAEEAS